MEAKLKDQFVPYELALKLKELGFDEKCFGWFNYNQEIQYAPSVVKIDLHNDYTLAPLWQQAFDWFREKGLDNTLGLTIDNSRYTYLITNTGKLLNVDHLTIPVNQYAFHKDARQACLEQLIELVEKN